MSMSLSDDDKRTFLTTTYSQLQNTALKIRDYLIKLTTGTSTLFLALDGWILGGKIQLELSQRIGLSCGILFLIIVASLAAYRFYREFQAVARLIVSVEQGMGLYENGLYIEGRSLYPAEYLKLGTNRYSHGGHIWLGPVLIMGLFAVVSITLVALF